MPVAGVKGCSFPRQQRLNGADLELIRWVHATAQTFQSLFPESAPVCRFRWRITWDKVPLHHLLDAITVGHTGKEEHLAHRCFQIKGSSSAPSDLG